MSNYFRTYFYVLLHTLMFISCLFTTFIIKIVALAKKYVCAVYISTKQTVKRHVGRGRHTSHFFHFMVVWINHPSEKTGKKYYKHYDVWLALMSSSKSTHIHNNFTFTMHDEHINYRQMLFHPLDFSINSFLSLFLFALFIRIWDAFTHM